jgi:hypothetical protein
MSDTQPSAARLEANRANAQHSTGPRTPEGKARSSHNAVKHGLFSASLGYAAGPLGEDRGSYDTLLDGLRRDHGPVGFDEHQVVDRMADLWWELARAHRLAQQHLRLRLDQGLHMTDVMKEMAVFGAEQSRIERSLTRQRKDLWLLQGRHNGAFARGARRALELHAEIVAAYGADPLAVRARAQAERVAEPPASEAAPEPVTAPHPPAPDGGPHLPASSPEGEEGTPERSPEPRPDMASDAEFQPEFADESLPEGPTNGSGRSPLPPFRGKGPGDRGLVGSGD